MGCSKCMKEKKQATPGNKTQVTPDNNKLNNKQGAPEDDSRGNPFKVIFIAVGVLFALSFVPWGKITGNFLKDYDLLEDLTDNRVHEAGGGELIDPELESVLAGMTDDEAPAAAATGDKTASDSSGLATVTAVTVVATDSVIPEVNPRRGETVLIEDYTPVRTGLGRFVAAVNDPQRVARSAMIGDSYIEGDVFSQNIREGLQELYGGRGVGFMALHSDIPGFRQSVRQTDNGWTLHDLRKDKGKNGRWLGGVYAVGEPGAKATFKGVSKLNHASGWSRATLLFIAPQGGEIAVDAGDGAKSYTAEASDEVQAVTVEGEMSSVKINNISAPGLAALGLWLEDGKGVGLDCMSLRGNSGVALRKLDPELAGGMRRYVDYDLIVVEYGLNALSSQQTDYSSYGKVMEQVVRGIIANYPNADILIMGVGDRGQKAGSEVHSIAAVQSMVNEQRALARRLGVLFWDTREAMGGVDAVVDWRKQGLINADYIHLNHKGGAELAARLVRSLSEGISGNLYR